MDEVSLYKKHFEFHSKLDYVSTINLSRIKEISKRINFASISKIDKFLITKEMYITEKKIMLQVIILVILL